MLSQAENPSTATVEKVRNRRRRMLDMVVAAVASARIGLREPLAARAPAREQTAEHEADPAAGRNIPSRGERKPEPFGVVAEVGLDRSEPPAHAPDEQQAGA